MKPHPIVPSKSNASASGAKREITLKFYYIHLLKLHGLICLSQIKEGIFYYRL